MWFTWVANISFQASAAIHFVGFIARFCLACHLKKKKIEYYLDKDSVCSYWSMAGATDAFLIVQTWNVVLLSS